MYIPWRRDVENGSSSAHIDKERGKGKTQTGKVDLILRGSDLDTRIKICILMDAVVPVPEHEGAWERNAKLGKKLEETVQMTAA